MRHSTRAFIAVVILALLYTLLPYFFGFATKRYVHAYSQHENTVLSKRFGLRLKFDQYKRGWFNSTAHLLIQKNVGGRYQTLRTIPVKIAHGPIYRIDGKFNAGLGNVSSQFVASEGFPYLMRFEENIAFNGEHTVLVLLSPKTARNKHSGFYFDELKVSGLSSLKADHFKLVLTAKGLHLKDPLSEGAVLVKTLHMHLNADYLKDNSWKAMFGLNWQDLHVIFPLKFAPGKSGRLHIDDFSMTNLKLDVKKLQALFMKGLKLRAAVDSQSTHANVNPMAWMVLAKQAMSDMVSSKTVFKIHGLTVKTPYGQAFLKHYDLSFPALKDEHTPFDVFTYSVSSLDLNIPFLHIPMGHDQAIFRLNDLTMKSEANTIFSQNSQVTVDSFSVGKPNVTTEKSEFHAGPLNYNATVSGGGDQLSQKLHWNLDQLCVSSDCYRQMMMKLHFDNLNYSAMPALTEAADRMMMQQTTMHNPQMMMGQSMALLGQYAKLITKDSRLSLVFSMQAPKGAINVDGQLAWPALTQDVKPHDLLIKSQYQLNIKLPASYIDDYLASEAPASADGHAGEASDASAPMHSHSSAGLLQYAIDNHYITKEANSYVLKLTGQGNKVMMNGKVWHMPKPVAPANQAAAPVVHPMQTAPVNNP